jgi:hypothetical protein
MTARLVPSAASQLASALALYDAVAQRYHAADEQFEAVKTAIKAAAIEQAYTEGQLHVDANGNAQHGDRVIVDLPGVLATPLVVGHVISRRIDTKRLHREHPSIAEDYSTSSPSWSVKGLS